MSQQTSTAYAIVLTNASLWHKWLSIIKTNAKQSEIWDLIDPTVDIEPQNTEPSLPKKVDVVGDSELTREDIYKDKMAGFNLNHRKYREKREALIRTLDSIQKSISQEYLAYIYDKYTPWQALRALSQAIAPHSSVRLLDIDRQYRILCQGPQKGHYTAFN